MKMFKSVVVIGVALQWLSLDATTVFAVENFSGIARMNVFRLNPPKSEAKPALVQPELPQVSLVGLATLLGPQALLKIQTKMKPVATEVACVLAEGQSRDGVSVLRIDVESGTVWLTNQGEHLVLQNCKGW